MNVRYEIRIWQVNHDEEVIMTGSTKVKNEAITERNLNEYIEKWTKMITKMMEEFQ